VFYSTVVLHGVHNDICYTERVKKITIAIDGPASSGKGTTARGVADALDYKYLDTGALYRMVTLYCHQNKIDGRDAAAVTAALTNISMEFTTDGKALLNGVDVSKEIRTPLINSKVSTKFARNPDVRIFVTNQSKEIVAEGGYVLDGRDAGAAIAPQAELKIYLDCDAAERARRRAMDFGTDDPEKIETILHEIILPRDEADVETIRVAKEQGVCIDTTKLSREEQINQVKKMALAIINS